MKRGANVLTLGALLFGSAASAAQDPYRQTVVVTAATVPVELGSVTRTVTVITRDQIEQLPVHTVADVLRLAASIDVRARGVRGVQTDFAVRGASFGQMLVLVDGVRLNDAQSGHHNGDIPVPLESVDRIEVLYGAGSSLFGADAFGGTVNVITRHAGGAPSLTLQGGSFGYAAGSGEIGFERPGLTETLSASADRSSGFMYDRDFKTAALRSRTTIGNGTGLSVAYLWKEFGANNFYGGNAPSREWTNQTLIAADRRIAVARGWALDADASYRTHGDHFIFNQLNPALSNNTHRTHAVLGSLRASTRVRESATFTVGGEGGGDWIRSTNLGDHSVSRVSAYGEWRQRVGARTQLDAAVRVDRYSEFGTSASPSIGASAWVTPLLRLRSSAGRAFRVPTFTERFYSDPANLARPEVGPETAWAGEGGADLFLNRGWLLQATVFGRADRDVIDWLRATTAERWRTYNIRDVATRGVELSARKSLPRGSFLQAEYTALDIDATAVNQLSKYLLDYAPRTFVAAASAPLPGRFRVAPRLEYRRRRRQIGTPPRPATSDYVLLDARVSRILASNYELYIEGTNLFDRQYQEIANVPMPGAAMSVGFAIRR